MKNQTETLVEAITQNIDVIDNAERFFIMHDYDMELFELEQNEDIFGLQDLLAKTVEDIQVINVNSVSN